MSVVVRTSQLRREMARRGWDAVDLARTARVSPATVSAALAGRAIAARSLTLIADALSNAPVLEVIDALLDDDPPGRGLS